MVAVNKSNQEE